MAAPAPRPRPPLFLYMEVSGKVLCLQKYMYKLLSVLSPSGLCATLAAMADARDVISIYLSTSCVILLIDQMLDDNITDASLACLHGRCAVRGLFDKVGMCISCDCSSLSAALVSMHSAICQGMSWQHLHQPCVAGKV